MTERVYQPTPYDLRLYIYGIIHWVKEGRPISEIEKFISKEKNPELKKVMQEEIGKQRKEV